MDQNEMTMDVKMDLKEKKSEYFLLRTWTKCIVKIEAIKYIPCFIKITLIPNGQDEKSNVVIKINIPGLAIQLAASRSKDHSYGLFWTQHRKKCCIFFALDSKDSLEGHIKWVQNSINNLEHHRREMLEFRRISRISKMDESFSRPSDVAVLPFNDTQDIKDINDILGPLPNVPDASINWSRRISGVSEIYEEIIEGDPSNRNLSRKFSRTSIASGIYEVMISPLDIITESNPVIEEIPPPLPPPRPRVNTQSEISRAYTNPESISSKKRKRNIFESVFMRHKTIQKQKSPKPKDISTKPESPAIELIRSHRMSYSSPDLSKIEVNHYENEFESDLMARSSATEFSFRNEHSFLNSTTSSTSEKQQIEADGNISDNILSTFNISCNESTVNLVGKNLNGTAATPKATIIYDVSGYCRMAPIIRNNSSSSPVSIKELPFMPLPVAASIHQSPNRNDLTKTITFRRDYGLEASIENFENLTISKDSNSSSIKDTSKESDFYKNNKSSSPTMKSPDIESKSTRPAERSKRNVNNQSFDEKYPSYHPNDVQKVTPKNPRHENVIDHVSNVVDSPYRAENLYIATPRHGANRKTMSNPTVNGKLNTFQACSPPTASFQLNPSTYLTPSNQSLSSIPPKNISSASPLLYQKYATVVTPLKVTDSCKKSSDFGNSIKRFATMPRFRKIDFSPLKLKINSVLQRQNSDHM